MGELLEPLLGQEGVEEALDDLFVGLGELLHLLEHVEQLAVLEVGAGGLVDGSFEQVVARDAENVGHALEGVRGGTGETALVAANVGVVDPDALAEDGLGEAVLSAELAKALGEAVVVVQGV